MAEIVGCLAMSHAPQLLTPPERWHELPDRVKPPFNPKPGIEAELTSEAKRDHADRCNAAITVLRDQVAAWDPDTLVIIGDDQEENILFDNMPAFTIFTGGEADSSRKYHYFGSAPEPLTRYSVNAALAEEVLRGAMDSGFDPAWSRKLRYHGGLGHAFGRVLQFLTPAADRAILPIMLNTYYPPAPSAKRCLDFGTAVGRLLRGSDKAKRVVIIASGGLSHTKIDESFDAAFIEALEKLDVGYLGSIPSDRLVSGTSEMLTWIAVAGAARSGARMVDYVPCYRTPNGVGCAMGFATWNMAAA
jgi:hypothetical protein